MPKDPYAANASARDPVVDLIAAVAKGDAAREDIVASLKDRGIDSLDVLVEVLVRAARDASSARAPARCLDVHQLSNATDPKQAKKIVHQVPRLPFVLRGTLYDPSDIARFDGQELHFISSSNINEVVVIDDRAAMQSWWQLSYISLNVSSARPKYVTARGGGSTEWGGGSVGTTDATIIVSPPGGSSGPEGFGYPYGAPPPPVPHTNFYEDINFNGGRLELAPNTGKWDLTEESMGFLGFGGDWNDQISSVQLVATSVAVLHEHVNMSGSSLTTTDSRANLFAEGFNDRASSVETW